MEILQAIADWPVAAHLRFSSVTYPLVNAWHIFSIGLLAGAIVTLDLRILGLFRGHPIDVLAPPLSRVAAVGLAMAAMSGALLFSVRPVAYAGNPAFLAKLALVACGVANALVLRSSRRWRVVLRGGETHPLVVASAAGSLCVWVAAVVAGRWIGFLE